MKFALNFIQKFALAVLALALLGPFSGGLWARTLDDVIKSGTIRIGINVKIPPRGFLNDKNEPDGFEVDVAKELARRLGVKLEIVAADSNERVPYVATDRVDAVLGGMTRTTERMKIIDFTVPISSDSYGIITKKEFGIQRLADLNKDNITIVMVRGTAVLPFVQALLPRAKFLLLESIPDRNRAFIQGRGQAIVDIIDSAMIVIGRTNPGIGLTVMATPELRHTYSCIGVAKGNESMRTWLNAALYEMHNEGFIRNSWKTWFDREMDNYPRFTEYF